MDKFLKDEVAASRIDGPFSIQDAHIIFDGHFRTAPLGFVEKPGSTALRLIRHHSKEDDMGFSTNGWLDPSIDATKFYTASDAADFVSIIFYVPFFSYFCPFNICTFFYTANLLCILLRFLRMPWRLGCMFLRASVLPPGTGVDHVRS